MISGGAICILGAIALWLASMGGCASDSPSSSSAAGAGAGGSRADSPVMFSAIYPMLFPSQTAARCNFCHSMPASDTSNGNLHMGSDMASAYAALVDQDSSSSKCAGKVLVVPEHPEQSLLLLKLSPNPPCGNRMPVGGMPLTAAQIALVRDWIAGGALDG